MHVAALVERLEPPVARAGPPGRSGSAAATSSGAARRPRRSPLVGQQQSHDGIVAIAGGEERQALHVVPVQVGQQDRAAERATVEQRA